METKSATDNKEKHGMKKQANIITHLLNLLAKDSEKVKCQKTTLVFLTETVPLTYFLSPTLGN